MMADVVFVAKITELLLPNGANPQLEPTASSLLRGDGLVLQLDGTRLASPMEEIPPVGNGALKTLRRINQMPLTK